jgi:single-strand DNA-binding protein
MTASLNKVQLIGNLGSDPKSISGKDGNLFVTVSLATNEAVKVNGEWQSKVEWHSLIFFGVLTKVTEYLHKGSQIYAEGRLRNGQWTDKEGNNRQSVSIVVSNIQLLGQNKGSDVTDNNLAESHLTQMREMLTVDSEEVPF